MSAARKRRGWQRPAMLAAAALLCIACTSTNSYYDPAKPHHTPQGFRNNYQQGEIGGSFIKWQWERWRDGLPKPPANGYAFPVQRPDVKWLQANRSQAAATWIGHASVLVQMGGLNFLTDPIFSERASPVTWAGPQRKVAPAIAIADLPHIDVVMISHNHYDHLDRDSVLALNAQSGGPPLFLVPLGVKAWMREQGIHNVRELDWWQNLSVSGIDIHFVPVQHWSARGVDDRFETLWGGWFVKSMASQPSSSFFFAGDTGYSKDFADIYQRLGRVDLALLPIGAYEPRWFMQAQHINPAEAVRIHQDLHAKQSLGIHWGTFELSDEPLDEPPRALARALQEAGITQTRFVVLPHGGMLPY